MAKVDSSLKILRGWTKGVTVPFIECTDKQSKSRQTWCLAQACRDEPTRRCRERKGVERHRKLLLLGRYTES